MLHGFDSIQLKLILIDSQGYLPFWTSMRVRPVVRNGLPRMRVVLLCSSISSTTKLVGKANGPTLTIMSSITPDGYLMEPSASWRHIQVGLTSSVKPSFLIVDAGIRLMLAPRSHKAVLVQLPSNVHGIRKLPGSLSFSGKLFRMTALHSSVRRTLSVSLQSFLWLRISFMNLA